MNSYKNLGHFKDIEAFKKHFKRQKKDTEWARDIESYRFWAAYDVKYNSRIAKERMEQIQTKWPGKNLSV